MLELIRLVSSGKNKYETRKLFGEGDVYIWKKLLKSLSELVGDIKTPD